MICIDFNSLNWGNLASYLSIFTSIVSILIAWYIFKSWENQKRKEVIAYDSNIILKEIMELRENILRTRNVGSIDHIYIEYVADKRDFIELILKQIHNEYSDLKYNEYVSSLTNLIRDWQRTEKIDDSSSLIQFGSKTNTLAKDLTRLKYYKKI